MSRFRTKYQNGGRLPKESRTIPLPGDRFRGNGEDFRKWYRCWYCSTVNALGRDELGGQSSRAGTTLEDVIIPSTKYDSGISLCVLGGPINSFQVALELDSSGDPKTIRHDFKSVIASGCRLCGSRNWLGKY